MRYYYEVNVRQFLIAGFTAAFSSYNKTTKH